MNPSTAFARALIEGLIAAGVREVVLCPGSRSAPLAYAAWSAERAGLLRLHVRIDERSAGFLALGLAKVLRRPAAVITTSGTAVANLHPAVLEADHAQVPLLVLSADRPARLRGSGANQTTTQPGIFAGAVRAEADLSVADLSDPADLSDRRDPADLSDSAHRLDATDPERPGLGRILAPLLQAARSGPVHLNVQFDDPLVPDLDEEVWQPRVDLSGHAGHSLWPDDDAESADASGKVLAAESVGWSGVLPARTLVVLGDLPDLADARRVLDWASARSLPVLAEPFGPHPRPAAIAHGVLVAGVEDFLARHEPEVIVVVGRPTLSRPISTLLRRPSPHLVLVPNGLEFSLPGRQATRLTIADLTSSVVHDTTVPGFAHDASAGDVAAGWTTAWTAAGEKVARALEGAPSPWPSGVALARVLAEQLPAQALLFLGSSNTPRDLEIAVANFTHPVEVIASRGLAGIDGCVSTAIGLALSAPERPAVAVLGDLTFLHDQGGLVLGPDEPRPNLTLVVVNDGGGGIFTTLEPGEPARSEPFERLFATPTGTDLAALARAHGIPHLVADTPEALAAAVNAPGAGLRIVEVPLDRRTHRAERERLRHLAATALAPPLRD